MRVSKRQLRQIISEINRADAAAAAAMRSPEHGLELPDVTAEEEDRAMQAEEGLQMLGSALAAMSPNEAGIMMDYVMEELKRYL